MIKAIKTTIEGVNRFFGYASGLGILLMGFILFWEVIARYVFNAPTLWAGETATYLFIWTMLAGSAYGLQEGRHVHIDLVVTRLPRRLRAFVAFLTSLGGTLFCSVVVLQAWEMAVKALLFKKHSPTPLGIPLVIPFSALLLGFALLAAQFLLMTLAHLAESLKGEESSC